MPGLDQVIGEETSEGHELPLDANFIEQAEYIPEDAFLSLNADHPEQDSIVRRLSVSGAKLLVGPRGCGKTTLMLKAFYSLLNGKTTNTLPVYVNFKLSLKLEPLYINTPNATFWFRRWLNLKIYDGLLRAVRDSKRYQLTPGSLTADDISSALTAIEAGQIDRGRGRDAYNIEALSESINRVLEINGLTRCVLLLDDAAHAFSPRNRKIFSSSLGKSKVEKFLPRLRFIPESLHTLRRSTSGMMLSKSTFGYGRIAANMSILCWRLLRKGFAESFPLRSRGLLTLSSFLRMPRLEYHGPS